MKTFALRGRERAAHRSTGRAGSRALMSRPAPDLRQAHLRGAAASSSTPSEAVELDGYRIGAYAVVHGTEALGYALVEDDRPGRFDPERAADARRAGRARSSACSSAARPVEAGRAASSSRDEVMGESRPGRKLVVHRRHRARARRPSRSRRAPSCSSTTARSPRRRPSGRARPATRPRGQAAELARDAEVSLLALTHLSSRYFAPVIEKEARAVFERTRRAARLRRDRGPVSASGGEPELAMSLRERPRAALAPRLSRDAAVTLAPSVPLTRSREARKGHA